MKPALLGTAPLDGLSAELVIAHHNATLDGFGNARPGIRVSPLRDIDFTKLE